MTETQMAWAAIIISLLSIAVSIINIFLQRKL